MIYGGIGLVHKMAKRIGLAESINKHLHLLKLNLPYHESDHVLNIAYNALCGGHCLEDIELRRNDPVYLNALETERIPDPTTAGDFCRRFHSKAQINNLQTGIDEARINILSMKCCAKVAGYYCHKKKERSEPRRHGEH